jgi:hypothetical protein
MSAMHEEVHEWASEKRQPNEKACQVSAVLAQQKGAGDNGEAKKGKP